MDFKNAALHFSQLLTNMPTYWTALARLIEVMRRSAKIEEAEIFIRRGEQNCQQPAEEAGTTSFAAALLTNLKLFLSIQVSTIARANTNGTLGTPTQPFDTSTMQDVTTNGDSRPSSTWLKFV